MTNCPSCGWLTSRRTGLKITTTRPFVVEKCTKCGLAFATPRPSEAELDEFYSGEYFKGSARYTDYCGSSWAAANAERMWRLLCQWQAPPEGHPAATASSYLPLKKSE